MTEADADGHAASAGGNACTAAALELHRALGTALTTARAPTAELVASRDLVNLVNLVHAPASDTLVIGSEYALHPDCTPIDLWHVSARARAHHGALLPPPPHRYFQLQAPGPGLWSLSLASGAELLNARHGAATGARHGGAVPGSRYAAPPAHALPVPLLSYTGATLDILVGADPNHGLSTRTTAAPPALAAAPASAAAGTALDETVHIFSLASGLLYERFLRIMMKTAVERASRPLKFWILGNFLSPTFRHAVNSGALATAVGAQVIASLIRRRSCSTIGRLIASDCV